MRKIAFFVCLAILASLANAAYLIVIEPVKGTAEAGDVIDLGVVGPGQKLELVAGRGAGEFSKNYAGESEALWDRMVVDATALPAGWKGEDSKYYETPMKAFVTVAQDADDGTYLFSISTVDEYDQIPPVTIKVKIRVSRELLEAEIQDARQTVGAGQPATYYVKLKNKSSASDGFEIAASGLPAQWAGARKVFVPHNSEQVFAMEVQGTEQGEYALDFNAKSLSSDLISSKAKATLLLKSDVFLDMQAASHGMLLFPTVEQALYSLLAVIANLL